VDGRSELTPPPTFVTAHHENYTHVSFHLSISHPSIGTTLPPGVIIASSSAALCTSAENACASASAAASEAAEKGGGD